MCTYQDLELAHASARQLLPVFLCPRTQLTVQLGEYMLKGWTLTDMACDRCHTTPLMRQPLAEAQREGHAPIQFCASCDGGPIGPSTESFSNRRASNSTSEASQYDTPSASTEPEVIPSFVSPPTTPRHSESQRTPPTSPPASHAASARGDPDAAADAISSLLLRGYSLLSSTCPEPTCRGIPLVGFPRRKDGAKDPRRECVSCGQRWVDEKDLANSGLRFQSASASASSDATSAIGTPTPTPARSAPALAPALSTPPSRVGALPNTPPDEGESPRTRARRELYAQGTAIMEERSRAAAMKKAEEEALKAAGLGASGMPLASSSMPSSTPASPHAAQSSLPTKMSTKGKGKGKAEPAPKAVPSIRAQPFAADDHLPAMPDGKLRVVLVSTGSVASIKMPLIVEALTADDNIEVQVVATDSSLYFYDRDALESTHDGVGIWADRDEWSDWTKIGDPILHIELRRWADLVVVVPCSADMLAKIAGGICDNLAVRFDDLSNN